MVVKGGDSRVREEEREDEGRKMKMSRGIK